MAGVHSWRSKIIRDSRLEETLLDLEDPSGVSEWDIGLPTLPIQLGFSDWMC